MSSFHQVCLIAKGKVEDCRALCEELEAEGYEEGYVPVPARQFVRGRGVSGSEPFSTPP